MHREVRDLQYLDLLLRIPPAISLIYHAINKFPIQQGAADVMTFGSVELLYVVAFAEIIGGLALVLGAFVGDIFTRLGGLALAGIMIGAVAIIHWPNGYSFANPGVGWEFHLAYIGIGLYFVIRGNGESEAPLAASGN